MKVGDLVRCKKDNDIGVVAKIRKISYRGEMTEQAFIAWILEPSYVNWLYTDSNILEVVSESR